MSQRSNTLLLLVVVLAACLTQFASDIYTPSLPAIAESLKTPVNMVQWSMAIYMFGVALSQLFYGPISEGVGRKGPMVFGMSVMLVGSVICMFAPSIQVLILGRFIQGCGAGACACLWRSIFRDTFTGDELAKYGSYLTVFIMFIVPAAPALGGYLQHLFGWQANFVFLCGYTLIALLAVILGYRETSTSHHPERLKPAYCLATVKRLLTSRIFMGLTLCTFLSYGAFFAWFTAGPVLLIEHVGLTPVQFGWLSFIGGGIAYVLAGQINGKFVTRFGMARMMRFGWSVMIVSGLLLLASFYVVGIELWSIAVPIFLFYFGSTFIWPNAFAQAFTPFGDIAGYAGTVYGTMQIAGGAVIGGIVSHLPDANQLPLATVFIVASIAAWFIYEIVVHRSQEAASG